jgi:hypothetical protein
VPHDLAGLLPSAEGRRVSLAEGNRAVIDGPFPESKQLVAGYWILQVPSMDEAVEWAERFPFEAWSRIYPGENRQAWSIGVCSSVPDGEGDGQGAGDERRRGGVF